LAVVSQPGIRPRVEFDDVTGEQRTDPLVLDLPMHVGTLRVNRNGTPEVHKELKVIADAMKRATDADGLKVTTRRERQQRDAECTAMYEEDGEGAG
jgi:hypothetical protein